MTQLAVLVPPTADVEAGAFLGALLRDDTPQAGAWTRAARIFQRLLDEGQHLVRAHEGAATVCAHTARAGEAVQHYRAALSLAPMRRSVLESLILTADCQPGTTIEEAWALRRLWWALHGSAIYRTREPHTNDPDPERPIRVGYVSGDFRHHSAGMAIQSVICGHSDAVQAVCYATHLPGYDDAATAVYQARTEYHDVSLLSEAALATCIRADRIDLLVDLSSFTGGNRLQTFCAKPAPIQLTGWGYAAGNGLDAMDGVILDRVTRGADVFAEPVIELPSVITWVPPSPTIPLRPERDHAPVFGAFHRLSKLNADVLRVWASLLARVPDATIVFKGHEYAEPSVQAWIRSVLPRAMFWEASTHRHHLAAYHGIDVVLDTWPQTGGVTTCEALYMGVPSVTLIGPRTLQRAAASILTHVGLESCITTTPADYVNTAVEMVTAQRAAWRAARPALRDRLLASPICVGYGEAVEETYRALWRGWCAGLKEPRS